MKILFCSPSPLDTRLGTPKALMELAAELEKLGWTCRVASESEIRPGARREATIRSTLAFADAVGAFLDRHARDFDVVDYDQFFLPFPRARFPRSTLLVARSALLHHHLTKIAIPRAPGLRPIAGAIALGPVRAARTRFFVWQSDRTFRQADLINVNNDHDRVELGARGFDLKKLVVVPLGLSDERLASFAEGPSTAPTPPRVAFVGAYEPRKGATDFPRLLQRLAQALPGCRLRLLGAGRSVEEVLQTFPADLAASVEVVPSFDAAALPRHLRDCSLGVFPSYLEGFGFGVLEMLAASLPVFAYDTPGPPMMLPARYLAPRGDVGGLAARVVDLLRSPERLEEARVWARERAQAFRWETAARTTSDVYADRVRARRGAA